MPGISCSLVTQGHPAFLGFHLVIREISWALEEIAYGDHWNFKDNLKGFFFEGKLENQLQVIAWIQFILYWGCVEMYQSKHRKESLTIASQGEWSWRFAPASKPMFLYYMQWVLNMVVGTNFRWGIIHSCGRCGAKNQTFPTISTGTCSLITWVSKELCLGRSPRFYKNALLGSLQTRHEYQFLGKHSRADPSWAEVQNCYLSLSLWSDPWLSLFYLPFGPYSELYLLNRSSALGLLA